MKCPIDGADLVMTERQGVEIDYCPSCRGVWLDRGELDKIIDRSVRIAEQPGTGYGDLRPGEGRPDPSREPYRAPAPQPYGDQRGYGQGYRDRPYEQGKDPRYRKRKESWLGELFDF